MASSARALRSLVAELAEMPARYRQAVLRRLEEDQAGRIAALLEEYAAARRAIGPFDHAERACDLSLWLIELVQLGDAPEAAGSPTSHTVDALRACAAELGYDATKNEERRGRFWSKLAVSLSFVRPSTAKR